MEFLTINAKKRAWEIMLVFILCCTTQTAHSQKKILCEDQIKGKNIQQANPVMKPVKWLDDNTVVFEKYEGEKRKFIAVESASGIQSEVSKDIIPKTEAVEKNSKLSPDGKFIAFTKDSNLYVTNQKQTIKLTHDGNDTIMNGFASWVYMEEILGRRSNYKAFWWSPDSKRLAFFRFNDAPVPTFTITDCVGQHGYVEKMRYPKPGDKNPKVKVGIVACDGSKLLWADFDENQDCYFGEAFWTPDSKSLWIQWMNREQNTLKIFRIDPESGSKTLVYQEKQATWISLDQDNRVRFLDDGRAILSSDKSGFNHLYLLAADGSSIRPITEGEFTVLNIIAVDEKEATIYFTCYKDRMGCVDFYRIGFDGKNLSRLSFGEYTHSISISPDNKYFVTTYSNCTTPPKVALLNKSGQLIAEIDDARNPEADEYEWPRTEIIKIKSRDGRFELPMRITWPLGFDPKKKYPVLIDVYGGPAATQVRDGWKTSSALNLRYACDGLIQVAMDHRGSLHFGKRGQAMMYRQLGAVELEDYSRCVEWLVENAAADTSRICINGFSYGGYITAYALTRGADVFTHGIAGGSVIDWMLYDAVYTERYMGTPENNHEGYRESSVLTHAHQLKGKLLLTHGILDENVHVQNTYQLVSKLEDMNKDFELMLYPSSRHGYGAAKNTHFRNLQIRFVYKHLLRKPIPAGIYL
jgi:dipeptidyl-peptidase-4